MDNPTIIASLISAGVAIVVLFVNFIMNRRSEQVQREIANQNIDANITAKARLKWIDNTRDIALKIIAYSTDIDLNIRTIIDIQKKEETFKKGHIASDYYSDTDIIRKNRDDVDNLIEVINESKKEMQKQKLLFALYFSKNEENNKIVNKAHKLTEVTLRIYDIFSKKANGSFSLNEADAKIKQEGKDYTDAVNSFINSVKDYTKKEWEKAKSGK